MSDSKGGHSSLDKRDDYQRPVKTMMEFKDHIFDIWLVKGIEKRPAYDKEGEEGVSYDVVLKFNGWPPEIVFKHATEKMQQETHRALKAKLMMHGVVII